PFHVLDALREGLLDRGYAGGVLVSLRRIGIGYGLSILGGMALGILLASSKVLEDTVGALLVSLQTLPSICWLPPAVLWFGLTEEAILFVVVMGSFLSITLATMNGIQRVPPLLVSAARTMGARGLALHLHVTLPAATPTIVDGMKQGWSFAWRSLMAGELLFGTLGLGHHLQMGRELNDISQVMAVIFVIVILGVAVDLVIFAFLERQIRERWGLAKD
ncbi:MAG TPA: ABC transporter permease, partial [Planctomycetota bacterium]|nr:ABC transporter permease [Planctomycetota bacterium]